MPLEDDRERLECEVNDPKDEGYPWEHRQRRNAIVKTWLTIYPKATPFDQRKSILQKISLSCYERGLEAYEKAYNNWQEFFFLTRLDCDLGETSIDHRQ
jgi:hypothetical protein